MSRSHFRPVVAAMLALAATAAAAVPNPAPPKAEADVGALERAPIESLQAAYLACDAYSRENALDAETAEKCVRVGDALRDRAFGGDFERMIAWWRSQRPPEVTGRR